MKVLLKYKCDSVEDFGTKKVVRISPLLDVIGAVNGSLDIEIPHSEDFFVPQKKYNIFIEKAEDSTKN